MPTRRSSTRPRASARDLVGQEFESGAKTPVGGYYAHDGEPTHFRKGRILPRIDGYSVTYRLVQVGSEKAKLRTPRRKPGLLARTAKAVDNIIGEHPNLTKTVIDYATRGRAPTTN